MIDAFLETIISPHLKQLAQHWDRARGPKRLPAWEDIRPRDIAPLLPVVWSYSYCKEQDAFVGRIAGDRIESVVGSSFRGKLMAQLFSGEGLEWLQVTCKRVIIARALHWGSGLIRSEQYPLGTGERIIMPLSSDGESADGVLGATMYPSFGITRPSFDFYEKEVWYPVRLPGKRPAFSVL